MVEMMSLKNKLLRMIPMRSQEALSALVHPISAVAFEEMRTPYPSGREICVQKFGNAYQRKEIEKRMTQFIFCLRLVETESRFFPLRCTHSLKCQSSPHPSTQVPGLGWGMRRRLTFQATVCIASMILRTARFLCVLYAEICINNVTADDVHVIQRVWNCAYGVAIMMLIACDLSYSVGGCNLVPMTASMSGSP